MSVVDAVPDELALQLYAGDSFNLKIVRQDPAGNPIVLEGALAAHVKDTAGADVTDFAIDDSQADSGVFVISLTAAQTRAMVPTPKTYFRGHFDIQWTDLGGSVQTLFKGSITCTGDITP